MARLFGGIFHDFLDGTWEEARGFLKEELEQLRTSLNHDRIDLADSDDVEGRVDYENLPEAVSAPSFLGAISNGDFQELPFGPGLVVGPGGISVNPTSLPFSYMTATEAVSPIVYPMIATQTASTSSAASVGFDLTTNFLLGGM